MRLADREAEGSFDKAEIARATGYEQSLTADAQAGGEGAAVDVRRKRWSPFFAAVTPLAFLAVIVPMVLAKLGYGRDLKGGDAAALVGGVAAVLMIFATFAADGLRKALDASADHVTHGFVFAFRAMGAVLPIAGFFFLGAGGELASGTLGVPAAQAPGLLFDLIQAAQSWIPGNHYLAAFGILLTGMITGIDGSGFAGLPLTGALSGALAPGVGLDPATLAAVGQMGAVWTGGGTLIAWSSLIAVARLRPCAGVRHRARVARAGAHRAHRLDGLRGADLGVTGSACSPDEGAPRRNPGTPMQHGTDSSSPGTRRSRRRGTSARPICSTSRRTAPRCPATRRSAFSELRRQVCGIRRRVPDRGG